MQAWRSLAVCAAAVIGLDVVCCPAWSREAQQPFICRTQEAGLGQPMIDNQEGIGHPVFDSFTGATVGYSKNCNIPTRVEYFYYAGSSGFKPFDPATEYAQPPADLRTANVDGARLPFVVRVEVGTINRFLYTIAMLAPRPESWVWNKKLVYWLRGGVGIGHQQGTAMWLRNGLSGSERALMPHILEEGYAIVSSSGNETGVQYNMRLSQQTAEMVKAHFVASYGKPQFTLGIGGSGGAVQQYLFAQNGPGLLDGGIPIQSYPDMITQTIPISDCPLLSRYFEDETARDPSSPWSKWSNQTWIEGMSASDTARNAWTGKKGSTECINGWRMAMPTVLNPVYKDPKFDYGARAYGYRANVLAKVKWTHWNDLADIYGTDSQGFAPVSVDNVGVQYGLGALAQGQIGVDEFLRINACVGGWKEQADFVQWDPRKFPFDTPNMKLSASCREPGGTPAPRRAADMAAIQKAYAAGQVFTGQRLGIPMIDLRPYLEAELNMHNARQSFSLRARLMSGNPAEVKQQAIWFIRSDTNFAGIVMEAIGVIDSYLSSGAAPAAFTDKCLDAAGAVIASGPAVWDGILDTHPPGACTKAYPILSSPRMVAGDSIKGDVFKCALKPVATALADGTYPAAVQFTAEQKEWLSRIFPQGVCDYSQAGLR